MTKHDQTDYTSWQNTKSSNPRSPNIRVMSPPQSEQTQVQQPGQKEQAQHMFRNINKYHSIFLSTIDENQGHNNPQLIRIKNNILLLLLVLAAYGIYYLIGNFIDLLILGYVTGLAYNQTKNIFTKFVLNPKTYQFQNQSLWFRFAKALLLLFFGLILPRLRYMLSNPQQFKNLFYMTNYLKSFHKNTNITVIMCQVVIILVATYILFKPTIKKIGRKIRPKNIKIIQCNFCLFVLLFTIATVAVIPPVLFKQISEVGFVGQQKIQQLLQCQLITFGSHNNPNLPLCSQKVTQNALIKQTLAQFQNQNQTVEACKIYIKKFQLDYLGQDIFHYDDIACTWYSIINKASNYSAIQTQDISTASIVSTGTSIFKTIFGNLTSILLSISNSIFNFTIWLTTFMLTNKLSNRYLTLKHIFSQNKQQLIGNITKLINSTCQIVFWHFAFSLILLQLFAFTPINLIISILLSLMAFVPLFRPWFGVLFVSIIRMIVMRQYIVPLAFIGIYWYISEQIYSFFYGKLQIHQIIVNFSVLFGIYSFGITGIFYGPLIVILYTCVQKQLLTNYHKNPEGQRTILQDDKQQEILRKKESQSKMWKQKQKSSHAQPGIKVIYLKPQGNNNREKNHKKHMHNKQQ